MHKERSYIDIKYELVPNIHVNFNYIIYFLIYTIRFLYKMYSTLHVIEFRCKINIFGHMYVIH